MLKMNSDLALLAPAKPFSEHLPIQFDGVHLSFGKHHIFSNLTLEIGAQGITAIMGPNGAGKSLILRLLAGLLMPEQGSVRFNTLSRVPRDQIGFVFQRFNLFPTLSALDNVKLAQAIQRWRNKSGRGDPHRAQQLLERVGLEDKIDNKPYEMSTGEQQRVAIARALVNRPHILLADEPTGNLDTSNSEIVMEVFTSLNSEFGQTMMVITHNPEVAQIAHRTIHMRDGMIVDEVDDQ